MSLFMHSSAGPHMHSSGPSMHGSDPGAGGGRPLDAYGFSGFPGNSLLAAGLYEARMATLLDPAGAPAARAAPAGVKPGQMDDRENLKSLGAKPRSAVALFELISSVAFVARPKTETAELLVGGDVLASLKRPGQAYFQGQLPLVEAEASLRDRRYTEILSQVAPPMAYYASVVNMQSERHAKTMLLLNTGLDFAFAVPARFKHALACPRPPEYSAMIQPMIEVPQHPSFPAGHAVEGHVLAGLLTALVPAAPGQTNVYLRRMAARVAQNRVIAGLHFPIDLVAGRLLGDALAGYVLACAGAEKTWQGAAFKLGAKQLRDFSSGVLEPDRASFADVGCAPSGAAVKAAPIPLLQQMWQDAQAEWL